MVKTLDKDNSRKTKSRASSLRFFRFDYLLATLLTGATLVLGYLGATFLGSMQDTKDLQQLFLEDGRDFSLAPFDMLDATRYCQLKTQLTYGDNLTQSYIDEYSTRVDSSSGIYKVFMVAHIGKQSQSQEKAVHCFVDPEDRLVTHYRSFDRYKTSLISKAIRFFK